MCLSLESSFQLRNVVFILHIAANTDTILDGFYDAGWLKTPTRIMTLEEYGMGEISDRRPIFLVNAKLEYVKNTNILRERKNKRES